MRHVRLFLVSIDRQRAMEKRLAGVTVPNRKTTRWLWDRSQLTDVTQRVEKFK